MALLRRYQCPDCSVKFDYLHHPNADEDPVTKCPACHVSFLEEPERAAAERLNYGGSNISRSVDKTYKDLEESSAMRAEAAGDPSLKITNMQDNLREGDVAVKAPNNAVTQYAQQTGHQFFQSGTGDGRAMAQGVKGTPQGGAIAIEAIQKQRMAGPGTNTFRK